MGIGVSFWWWDALPHANQLGSEKRRWNLETSSAAVEFQPLYRIQPTSNKHNLLLTNPNNPHQTKETLTSNGSKKPLFNFQSNQPSTNPQHSQQIPLKCNPLFYLFIVSMYSLVALLRMVPAWEWRAPSTAFGLIGWMNDSPPSFRPFTLAFRPPIPENISFVFVYSLLKFRAIQNILDSRT